MGGHLDLVLLAAFSVLLVAVLAVRVAARTGLPSLLLYLALGLAVGQSGIGVRFTDYGLTADLGLLALAVLLAEGGLTTRWSAVRPALPLAVVLSTVGVVVAVAVLAGLGHLLLGLSWRTAVLLGAVLSSTDAAAVFSVLRTLPLAGRVRAVLEAESGLNDAPVVVIVVLSSSGRWGHVGAWSLLGAVAYQLLLGAAVGLLVGWVGAQLLRRAALPSAGLYPVATVALALLAWAAGSVLHASGFLAVYLAGLVLGNAGLPHRRAVLGFASSTALLAEIGLFVLLGLLASPARLPGAALPALALTAIAALLARPLAVLVSAAPFRVPWRTGAFLSWAGLRGAVPIVLATVPVAQGVPGAQRVVDVVFVVVLVSTLVQAPSLPSLGRVLGVLDRDAVGALEVETAPLEATGADLLQLRVRPGSRLHGVYVDELRLPTGAQVVLLLRDGGWVVPRADSQLAAGDDVLVVAAQGTRQAAERRLRAVAGAGKLAGWYAGGAGNTGNAASGRGVDPA